SVLAFVGVVARPHVDPALVFAQLCLRASPVETAFDYALVAFFTFVRVAATPHVDPDSLFATLLLLAATVGTAVNHPCRALIAELVFGIVAPLGTGTPTAAARRKSECEERNPSPVRPAPRYGELTITGKETVSLLHTTPNPRRVQGRTSPSFPRGRPF